MITILDKKPTTFARCMQGELNMQPNVKRAVSLLAFLCCAVVGYFALCDSATGQVPDAASTVSKIIPSRPATAVTGQSATLLPSGQWLLLGGERDGTVSSNAILYEGSTKVSSTLEVEMIVARSGHTATVIPDGSVLIIGGFGADGKLISGVERFDPDTETFELLALDLSPRADHTATLLTDGRLLIVGGLDAEGNVRADVEILDIFSGAVERFDSLLETARSGHLAALLPSAPVLVWGGFDQDDRPIAQAELFDPQTRRFGPIDASTRGYLPDPLAALATPVVTGTHPDSAIEVAVDAVLTARFSKPLDVTTLNSDTVTLFGPHGPEAAQIVAAEAGMLLFVTPASPMTPGAVYTLFISGARDASGQAMPLAALPFRTSVLRTPLPGRHVVPLAPATSERGSNVAPGSETSGQRHATSEAPVTGTSSSTRDGSDASRRAEAERQLLGDDEFWVPGPKALRGDWRSKRFTEAPHIKALKAVAELKAPEGVTAVTGHVLRLNGRPLSNVSVSMNGRVAYTDGIGRFLLTNVSAGWQRLSVDGSTANRQDAQYGRHDMRVYVTAGKTNPLVWTVWLPKLDTVHAIHLDSPTQRETVLSSPYIPGLEFRVPAGTVVRDRSGNIVTQITITPVPIDQPSHPLPDMHIPGYFTVQPSGLRFESATGELLPPVRLRYPNTNPFMKLGDPATFWSYDPDEYGWQVYAEGQVTDENVIELQVDGMHGRHGIRHWEDGMHSGGPPAPTPGDPCRSCPCQGGGPPSGPMGPDAGGGAPSGPGAGAPGSNEVGDPCSVATGQFTLASTDLSVRDFMPFDVTRVYRPNDARTLAFGIGTSWPFAMYIASIGASSLPLVMANGTRIYFDNINNNTDHGGIFVNSTTPGVFYGATLTIVPDGLIFTILRKDGTLYTFDAQGNLTAIRSRTGATISITRSGTQVNRISSPSGRWLSFTYSGGLISQVQDHTGRTVSYGYTSSRLTSVTNAAGGIWRYAYDGNGRMSTVTDARNNLIVTNTYDTNGRVATQTYADGSSMQFAYTLDTNGNVTQTDVTDRNGSVRRVQLDAAGNIQQDIFPLGAPEQQTATFTRDPTTHLLLSTTDALARRGEYTYDANGNMLTITALAGTANAMTTTYTYESAFNRVASITDPLNHTTTLTYDPAGNMTQRTDPLNHATTMTYDSQGQLLTVTDALNNTTSYAYDAGVLATITDALNRTTTMFSDALGRVIRVTDPLGNAIATTYDALDRVTRVTDPLGNSVNYEYDANGNLTAHVDQNGNRTGYTYDAMNRLIGRQDPLLHSDTYAYDQSSMLKQFTDRLNQVTGHSYDNLHRRTQSGFGATPSNPTAYTNTIGYTYDVGNRMLAASDSANGTITRGYDGLDRLTQEITPNGTVSYTYYANGLRQTMTVTGQPVSTYGYDNANRLTSISKGSLTVAFTYDNANRRTQISLPNGVTMNYGYDTANQLTSITYQNGATTLGDLSYAYDNAGHRINIGGSFATVNLPNAVASATYNVNNQLTRWDGQAYSYDLDGNLIGDGTQTYAWNARRQLSGITQAGNTVASYSYDAVARRSSKTLVGSTTAFVYDGLNFVQEKRDTNVLANLISGLSFDEVYVRQAASNEYFLPDVLGTIMMLTDATGSVTTVYNHEPYGKVTQSGAVSTNSQRFTGREDDDVTGLMYYRARYYVPNVGRFASEDPIGIADDVNLYAYVGENPIGQIDPLGLARRDPPKQPPKCRTAKCCYANCESQKRGCDQLTLLCLCIPNPGGIAICLALAQAGCNAADDVCRKNCAYDFPGS